MNTTEYLFLQVMEEASEISVAASKCLRFTLDHQFEAYNDTNFQRFQTEIRQLVTVLDELSKNLDRDINLSPCELKRKALAHYMGVSRHMGTLA